MIGCVLTERLIGHHKAVRLLRLLGSERELMLILSAGDAHIIAHVLHHLLRVHYAPPPFRGSIERKEQAGKFFFEEFFFHCVHCFYFPEGSLPLSLTNCGTGISSLQCLLSSMMV